MIKKIVSYAILGMGIGRPILQPVCGWAEMTAQV